MQIKWNTRAVLKAIEGAIGGRQILADKLDKPYQTLTTWGMANNIPEKDVIKKLILISNKKFTKQDFNNET